MKADEIKKMPQSDDYYKGIYDYINSEKETEPKADNKIYYVDKKDFNDFKSYIHFDELKEYLEKNKDKLNIEGVKNFYVEKKLDMKCLEKDGHLYTLGQWLNNTFDEEPETINVIEPREIE